MLFGDDSEGEALLNQVDVAFVFDTTGSMAMYLAEARQHAREVADQIAKEGELDLRFAVVEYRDHPPQDLSFVTRVYPFTDSAGLDRILAGLAAEGGGDEPEAVWDGLADAGNLQWRPQADHRCFLIGDSPPHGHAGGGDGFATGCPCGIREGGLVELFGHKKITLHAHSIAGNPHTHKAFAMIAEGTGGEATQVDRPAASTAAYATTMTDTSKFIGDTKTFASYISSTPGATVASASATLGWTTEKGTSHAHYMEKRGIKVEAPEDRETPEKPA